VFANEEEEDEDMDGANDQGSSGLYHELWPGVDGGGFYFLSCVNKDDEEEQEQEQDAAKEVTNSDSWFLESMAKMVQ
jgi:hypothetical protein